MSYTSHMVDCLHYAQFATDLRLAVAMNLGIPADRLEAESSARSAPGAADRMFEHFALERRAIKTLQEAFQPMFRHITDQVLLLVDSFAGAAVEAYRRHHRRLPGSDRTARLRKKRRVLVLRWYVEEYLPGERSRPLGFQGPVVLAGPRS